MFFSKLFSRYVSQSTYEGTFNEIDKHRDGGIYRMQFDSDFPVCE